MCSWTPTKYKTTDSSSYGEALKQRRSLTITAFNDGSVCGWQKHSVHAGKNFAGSGACGPWMLTADEIDVPEAMTVTTWLNG